jgi:hypothetical protein
MVPHRRCGPRQRIPDNSAGIHCECRRAINCSVSSRALNPREHEVMLRSSRGFPRTRIRKGMGAWSCSGAGRGSSVSKGSPSPGNKRCWRCRSKSCGRLSTACDRTNRMMSGCFPPMTASSAVARDANERRADDHRRGTAPEDPMTCHRIQLAGAVDAIEHGEPAEKSCKGSEGIAGKENWPRCFGNADVESEGVSSRVVLTSTTAGEELGLLVKAQRALTVPRQEKCLGAPGRPRLV